LTIGIFFVVLGAAFLHASWNALIKTGTSKQSAMLILAICQGTIGVGLAIWRGAPVAEAWPWLIGSGIIHMFYQLFLSYAYEHGDLSRVYPIARGAAPMMVLVVSAVFLSDPITPTEIAGILVLGAGILLMAHGVFSGGESRKMLPFALGSAVATAGYSITDGMGARVAGDAILYVGWLMAVAALFYVPVAIAIKGPAILRASPRAWGMGMAAGALSLGAYSIAVWAMTIAPIAVVAALRETSILFAVLIGWLAFGEPMTRSKALAAGVIVLGVLLTRLA
jgi:drug/metabolite transporter (DMT)-like permease